MSNILKGLHESRSDWDNNMSGYRGDYGGAENWDSGKKAFRRQEADQEWEREQEYTRQQAELAQYNETGKFWLKLKDSQRHLPAGPFIGKQAANVAALELLKQQPELRGNLVITAYGPDETQDVAEDSQEAPSKHHTATVSYHKTDDPHRRYEARFKTTHNLGKEETEKRAKAAFAAKGKVVYNIVHEQGVAEGEKKPHPQTWHDVDPKLGRAVDKMSQAEKVAKGLAHPDTLNTEKVYKVLAVDKSNALSKQVKLKVKASSLDEVFERLAINDWYPLEINGVEVIAGKRLKQSVAEGIPDVDHMNGPRGIGLDWADTRDLLQKPFEHYGNYKEWYRDVNRVNSELLDDNAEFSTMSGGKIISINGKDFAFWSNRNGNGSIDIGIAKKHSGQGVAEGLTTPKVTFAQSTPGSWARIDILVNGVKQFVAAKTIGPGFWSIFDLEDENIGSGSNKSEIKSAVLDYLSKQGVAEGSGFDKWADDRAASQLYKLNPATTWEVSFDYGPHQSETVKVKAMSAQEAVDKVETAAEKKGRSIMVNWARPAEQGQLDELSNNTLASYKKKAGADATQADKRGDYARGDKRMSGIIKATKKEFDNDAKGVTEAGNKPIDRQFPLGTGDTRTPRDIKSQMRDASDKFVQQTAASKTGPLHSRVAKMQNKMAKSELRKRDDHDRLATGTNEEMSEEKQRLDPSCWKGYKKQGTKMKGDTRVNNCVPVKESAIMKGLK